MRKTKAKPLTELLKLGERLYAEGTSERRAYDAWVDACAQADAIHDVMADPRFEGKNGRVPDKHREDWEELLALADKRNRIVLQRLNAMTALLRHSMTVPEKEVSRLIVEALTANAEALDHLSELSGLDRHHEFGRVAKDIIADWKSARTKVREENMEPQMCDSCLEGLAA